MLAQEGRFLFCQALTCECIHKDEVQKTLVVNEEDGAEVVQHPRIDHGLQCFHPEGQKVFLIERTNHNGIVAP